MEAVDPTIIVPGLFEMLPALLAGPVVVGNWPLLLFVSWAALP